MAEVSLDESKGAVGLLKRVGDMDALLEIFREENWYQYRNLLKDGLVGRVELEEGGFVFDTKYVALLGIELHPFRCLCRPQDVLSPMEELLVRYSVKGLGKDKIAVSTCLSLSKDDIRSLTVVRSCVSHEKPEWNMWLRFVRILF